jgi:hypothetical protein
VGQAREQEALNAALGGATIDAEGNVVPAEELPSTSATAQVPAGAAAAAAVEEEREDEQGVDEAEGDEQEG